MDGGSDDDSARPQGRPPRGAREMGRDHLIESTRGAMRVRPRIDIQRREIAEHAGVTPALVSYYFPDKALLLEVAAQPVIDAYAADVRLIIRSQTLPNDRLKRLISLFLAFNTEQGFILDHYLEVTYAKRRDSNVAMLTAVKSELAAFFEELIALGLVKGDDPEFLPAALWGLCRYVGRRGDGDVFQIAEDLRGSPKDLAHKVLSIFQT